MKQFRLDTLLRGTMAVSVPGDFSQHPIGYLTSRPPSACQSHLLKKKKKKKHHKSPVSVSRNYHRPKKLYMNLLLMHFDSGGGGEQETDPPLQHLIKGLIYYVIPVKTQHG